jgi:hypothetical protein
MLEEIQSRLQLPQQKNCFQRNGLIKIIVDWWRKINESMGVEESTPNQTIPEKKKKEKHEFWGEQPVKQFDEEEPEQAKEVQKIDKTKYQTPVPLSKEFKWRIEDLKDEKTVKKKIDN